MPYDWESIVTQPAGTPNPHLGTRFDATGRFLPEQGNTVVAQVVPGSPTEAELVRLRETLMSLPHGDHFAYTAIESYHMTVFEGVVETRRQPGYWPAGTDFGTDIDTMTALMADRLAGFAAPPDFAMRVTDVTPFGLRLTGASPADESAARAWRDALSAALGLRTPAHDGYGFHTTVAYAMQGLPAEALPAYRQALGRAAEGFAARVPVLHLQRPAFCRFHDMNAFPPVRAL